MLGEATLDALLLAINLLRTKFVLLRTRVVATLDTLSLAIDAMLLAVDALVLTVVPLDLPLNSPFLTLNALRTLGALLALDAFLTFDVSHLRTLDALHLPFVALRTLDTLGLLLTFLALRSLSLLLTLLTLLTLLALRALGLLAAILLGFGLRRFVVATASFFGRCRGAQGQTGNASDQIHLAGHQRPPISFFLTNTTHSNRGWSLCGA